MRGSKPFKWTVCTATSAKHKVIRIKQHINLIIPVDDTKQTTKVYREQSANVVTLSHFTKLTK